MAEILKNMYNKEFIKALCDRIIQVIPSFDSKQFSSQIFNKDWEQKELKQRYHRIAEVLYTQLSPDFDEAVNQLIALTEDLEQNRIDAKGRL